MFKGNLIRGPTLQRVLLAATLACALPAISSTSELVPQAPEPNAMQRTLIDVHATTGVGWWSPAIPDIYMSDMSLDAKATRPGNLAALPGALARPPISTI